MAHDHLYALIMAGGGGTRLWPLSRRAHPKQTLRLFGERTMFQLAVDRLRPLLPMARIFVVTAAEQVGPLAAQVPDLPRENFIIEPMGRGTAPCIGLSALHLRRRDPEAVMAVLTADHFIRREATFREALLAAAQVAEEGYLVTLGIEPTYPATGYGYIERGALLEEVGGFPVYRVAQFREKPDAATAMAFLADGRYSWNSGMFIWKVSRILDEMRRLMPDLGATLAELSAALEAGNYEARLSHLWPQVRKETIDYGVMERAQRVAVLPVEMGWSDVGSWAAVMALHEADEAGNVSLGEHLAVATERTMVFAEGKRLIATVGVRDLIIVDTPDALLVTTPEASQQVREVVRRLREHGREDVL